MIDREKAQDEARLQLALKKEENERLAERRAGNAMKEESRLHQQQLLDQMAVEKASEDADEHLRQAEMNKHHDKIEAKRQAEADARKRLMEDVMRGRDEQIQERRRLAAIEKEEDNKLRREVEEFISQEAEAKAEKKRQQRIQQRAMFEEVQAHVQLAESEKRAQRQAAFFEAKHMQTAESEYQRVLADMKKQPAPLKQHNRRKNDWNS